MLKKLKLFILFVFSVQLSFSKIVLGNNKTDENSKFYISSFSADTATIDINLNNGQRASFYYTDEYGDTDPPFFISAKDHIKKLDIRQPILLIDSYHQIPFLIYPGEKLTLKIDGEGLPVLTVEGNDIRNNELYLFVEYYKKLSRQVNAVLYAPAKTIVAPTTDIDFRKLINSAKSDSGKRFAFLRNYKKVFPITNGFANYTYGIFKYLYNIDVLRPVYYRGVNLAKLPLQYTNYVDSLREGITCDSCLSNESYRRAVLNLKHYLNRDFKQKNNIFSLSYNNIASSFTGLTRRYVLFIELKNYLSVPPLDYENKYVAFINEKDDIYSRYLIRQRTLANRFKINGDSKKEIADISGVKYTWEELLAKYKGYIIYVDFWASWCSPCRYNLTFSEKLKVDFKNKKILFLDISIDDNPSDWQKAMHEEHMDKKMNYLLLDEKNAEIKKQYKISSIPRYFIVNRNGVVADDNAIYPNDSQVTKVLSNYLDQ
ncbi:MAG: TlpA family protein disulfide reductase [Bacteroidota bacterium]|nr:TlpA family protein disulfide reductase [Bacteroidota bacterium]